MNEQEYTYLKSRILKLLNIDLDSYKLTQMRRRLDYFVSYHANGNIPVFCRSLEADAAMLEKLRNFLTINVSEFFRDKHSFAYLEERVLSELVKTKPRINIWSAGCSRGQEPYSLSILLREMAPYSRNRILATDIDPEALNIAKKGGPHNFELVKNVPEKYLKKYFIKNDEGYFVKPELRNIIEFRQQSLLDSSFEGGFDLILCRNVTIYLTDKVKNDINRKFFDSLNPGGCLFIGGTEVILDATRLGFISLAPSFYKKPELPSSKKNNTGISPLGKRN